ncbi:hypothetical protein HOY80DRAFT_886810 [Tuber brumale]|nr:hypothetical protein HOY80DRAFT_886810 [Tuber brumale]
MSSTTDSGCPPTVGEKACVQIFTHPPNFHLIPSPLLDHIATDSPEDSYTDLDNPTKLKDAKNISTPAPEVEGEDNKPVTIVEDYPSTPVSTMDSSLQALPLTGDNRGDSASLPPTPEEPEFDVSKEAEAASLPPPIGAEGERLDGADEPKTEVKENLEKAEDKAYSELAEGNEVVNADEKIEVPDSLETRQESSEGKAVDLKTEGESLESPVDEMEEASTLEATIPELNPPGEEPSEAASAANGEVPAAVDETPTSLDGSDLETEVFKAAEPTGENDGESGDTPMIEVAEDVTEKPAEAEELSLESINTGHQDNTEAQTIQDSELAIDEPKAESAAYENGKDNKVQQEHEAGESEHPEVTEPVMGNTDPNAKTAGHVPDAVMEAVIEEHKDEEVKPEAKETDIAVGDYEPKTGSEEAVPVAEADSVPPPEQDSVAEGSGMAQSEARDSETENAPELAASSEAEGTEETRPETIEAADTEPEGENLLLEKGAEATGESNDEAGDESKKDSEVLKEDPEEEAKEEVEPKTTKPTEAESPAIDALLPAEPPKVDVSIYSTVNEDTEPGHTEGSEESMKVGTKYEVEDGPKSEAAEIPELVKPQPTVPDVLSLTEVPKDGEIPYVDVDANPQSGPAEETVNSASEEPREPEGVGALAATGASDDGPSEEFKKAGEETTKSEPVTELEPTKVPTVIVEKTVENQPSHGEDLGPGATEGQKEAFEMRKADAEPDEVIVVEERAPPQILPIEEGTFGPALDKSEEVPSEATNEINVEPATSPMANEEGGDLAQDEPVVVSHDDAPPDDVERAEAAVEYPKPDPQEEVDEAPKAIEAEKDGKLPVSPEQAQAELEGIEAAAGSSPSDKPQSFEDPSCIAPERAPTPEIVKEEKLEESKAKESGVVAPTEASDKAKEPISSEEPEEAPVAQEIAHLVEPVGETSEESVADSPLGSGIKLDQDSPEGVVTSDLTSPEDAQQVVGENNPSEPVSAKPSETLLPIIGDVKPTTQPETSAETQPGEQIFSVNPLPDSKTFGNPIDLQPGEPIPLCLTEASVADNVKLDEEISNKFYDKTPVAEQAKAEESDDGTGQKILATGVGVGLVGLGAYAVVDHYDEAEAGKHSSEKASPVSASPTDPRVGDVGSPAVDVSTKSIPSTSQEQVLPVEISFTTPTISRELSEPPIVSKTEIGSAHLVDKSKEEIIEPASTELLGKKSLLASATDIPDESASSLSVGGSVPGEGDEVIAGPAPRDAPSPVHGVVAPEEHVPEVLKDTETSETPAIVVSSPPNPATGSSTAEVIQASSSEVAFDEASANKARESENTPEGVRRRRAPGAGGEVSRPTSSGTDTVSTLRHKNIMNGFWHVVLFGWLGGFGRFFGGIFSKSRLRKQRK